MTSWLHCCMLVTLVATYGVAAVAETISGYRLSEQLRKLAENALFVGDMQEHLDRHDFTETVIDGKLAVDELVKKMDDKIGKVSDAVEMLRDALEKEYDSDTFDTEGDGIQECCNFHSDDMEYLDQFKARVDLSTVCYEKSRDGKDPATLPSSHVIADVMRSNDAPFGTWQYMGTEEGVTVMHPASNTAGACGEYDPRYRPWYVETAVPVAKDLVICLDVSESMKGVNLEYAKKAIDTVISTMNPNDRIGLVTFSGEADTPGIYGEGCFGNQLAYAIPANQRYLKDYLNSSSVEVGSGTDYVKALEKAFDLLRHNRQDGKRIHGKDRQMALMFFTDGKPMRVTPEHILNVTRRLNAEMNNQVMILTYGFGQGLDDEAKDLLRKMASVNTSANSEVRPGQFRYVESLQNLRHELGIYYNAFADYAEISTPKASAPYIDFYTKSLLVSTCLPVYSRKDNIKTFRGVTCTDFSLPEILADVQYFSKGELSYGFIINGDGRVLLHPLVPTPEGDYTEDPFYLDIEEVETDPLVNDVLTDMKRGGEGQKRFKRNILIPTGKSVKEGVLRKEVYATYSWKKIPNTNFSICIVITDKDKAVSFDRKMTPENFVYHNLNLLHEEMGVMKCKNFDRVSTKDFSVVKLAAESFEEPFAYLNRNETKEDVTKMSDEIKGIVDRGLFKDGVSESVSITEYIERKWMQVDSYYNGNTVWRYMCTFNGVCRVFPGVAINQEFDHKKRPWCRRSIANRDKYALSTPYIDGWGAGLVLTLSHTLFVGNEYHHSIDDMLFGVISMDIKLHFLKGILQDLFPACNVDGNSCFILESSGHIVYHDDLLKESDDDETVEYIHVAEKEPAVAVDLINRGFLQRRQCRNLDDKREYHTWKMDLPNGAHRNWDSEPKYDIDYVPETNVYVVIKASFPSNVQCSCKEKCSYIDRDTCDCPCFTIAPYDSCKNKYEFANDLGDLCIPEAKQPASESPINDEESQVKTLPSCFKLSCEGKGTDWECGRFEEKCSWCFIDQTENRQRCRNISQCLLTESEDPNGSPGTGYVVGTVIASLFMLCILTLVGFWVLTKKHIGNEPVGSPLSARRVTEWDCLSDLSSQQAASVPGGVPTTPSYMSPTSSQTNASPQDLSSLSSISPTYITHNWPNRKLQPYSQQESRQKNNPVQQEESPPVFEPGAGNRSPFSTGGPHSPTIARSNAPDANARLPGVRMDDTHGPHSQDRKITPDRTQILQRGQEGHGSDNKAFDDSSATSSESPLNPDRYVLPPSYHPAPPPVYAPLTPNSVYI